MRIIAGRLGGRQFTSPRTTKTHPMSDKMRGALFNILGDIEGLTVLDAFAGSGAVGFEAISRDAAQTLSIEQDKVAQAVIAENIVSLGLAARVKLIKASVSAWLQTNTQQTFDIIVCDPPYRDLQLATIKRLAERVTKTGLLVLSLPTEADSPELPDCELLERRTYGDGSLAFYHKIQ